MAQQDLSYFIGKVCSVFTQPCNRDFRLEGPNYLQQYFRYFLGVVESIDDDGLLLTQVRGGLKTYIFREGLVALAEEEVIDPDSEEAKTYQPINQPEQPAEVKLEPAPELPTSVEMPDFLDIDSITNIASNLRDNFGK